MYLGLCMIGVVAAAWAITAWASRPKVETPDGAAMTVFASLDNDTLPGGMPFAEILDPDSVPQLDSLQFDLTGWETPDAPAVAVADVDLSPFDHLPPIYDPGLPVTRSAAPPVDNGWPQVA